MTVALGNFSAISITHKPVPVPRSSMRSGATMGARYKLPSRAKE